MVNDAVLTKSEQAWVKRTNAGVYQENSVHFQYLYITKLLPLKFYFDFIFFHNN